MYVCKEMSKSTSLRSFRIEDDLWETFKNRASESNDSASSILIKFISLYNERRIELSNDRSITPNKDEMTAVMIDILSSNEKVKKIITNVMISSEDVKQSIITKITKIEDKLQEDVMRNNETITPKLESLDRQMTAMREEFENVKKPKPSYLIR